VYLKRYQHLYHLERTRIPEPDDGPDMMRLQRNEKPNDWPRDLLDQIFDTMPDSLLQRYPDPSPVYHKLAEFVGAPEDNLLLTSGVDEAIRTIMTLSCGPGDVFSVPWPCYAMYGVYGRIFDLEMAPITYTPDRFTTPGELCEMVPEGAKVLFLPNPCQPVENCFDLDQLSEIASHCRERDLVMAVDESYYLFGAPTAVPLVDRFDNLLVMRSFSKAFGAASMRFGYVVGSPKALIPLSAFRLAHESNGLCLHAASVLLDSFHSHVKPSIRSVCQGRDFLRNKAIAHGLPAWGEVSNTVLIDLGSNEKMTAVGKALEARQIYVKWGLSSPLDQHILVTCGPQEFMERFFAALLDSLEGY